MSNAPNDEQDRVIQEKPRITVNGDNALMEAKLMMATCRTSEQALQLLFAALNSGDISQEGLEETVTLLKRYG